jgi:hypothetical protein
MASALGFLLVPVFLGRARLPVQFRWFLYWMLPCLLVTAWFQHVDREPDLPGVEYAHSPPREH